MEEELGHYKVDTVILCLLDNNTFIGRQDNQSMATAMEDRFGGNLIIGRLELMGEAVLRSVLDIVKPILLEAGDRSIVFSLPMPRYLVAPCCGTEDHLTNWKSLGYKDMQRAALDKIKTGVKTFLEQEGLFNARVMDPLVGVKHMSPDQIWDKDHPEHPNRDVIRLLVGAIKKIEAVTKHATPGKRKASKGAGMHTEKKVQHERTDRSDDSRGSWWALAAPYPQPTTSTPWTGMRGCRGNGGNRGHRNSIF